jgi:hypothetical protein
MPRTKQLNYDRAWACPLQALMRLAKRISVAKTAHAFAI